MKREDYYIQEALKYAESETLNAEALAFIAGMKMADTHPNWIKVEDRLPEAKYRNDIENGYSDIVLVCGFRYTPKGVRCRFSDAAYYDHEYRKWYDQNDDAIAGGVTHWMPIALPKED